MKISITSISDLKYRYTGDISEFNGLYTAILIDPIDVSIMIDDAPLSFTIPVGFVTDFGTIPKLFQWIAHPRGTSDRAFVVHDWLCISQIIPQIITDKILQQIMAIDGTPRVERDLIYISVRLYDIFIRKHPRETIKLLGNNEQILHEYMSKHTKIII